MKTEQSSRHRSEKMAQGMAFEAVGNLQAAETIYRAILNNDRRHEDALHQLGRINLKKRETLSAIALIKRAIAVCRQNHQYYNSLAAAYEQAEDLENAIAAYLQALALSPRCIESLLGLGLLYKRRHELELAIECFQKVIAIDPHIPMAYNNLGTTLRARGDLIKAVACFRRALSLDPNYLKAILNIGNALQKMGDHKAAIAAYQKALALDANFAPAYLNLGFACQAMGWVDEATDAFQNVLNRNPENAKAIAYLLHQYQYACDWQQVARLSRQLERLVKTAIDNGTVPAEPPFLSISRHMDPALNYNIARLWSRDIQQRAASASFSKRSHYRPKDD